MKGLLYKEFRQIISNKVMLIVVLGFLTLIINGISRNAVYTSLPIVAFILAIISLKTQAEDEKNSFERFGLSCPLNHKEFILPKYIIMWGFSLFIFVLSVVLLNLFSDKSASEITRLSFFLVFIQMIIPCFLFPLSYKVGSQTAQISFAVVFFATIFLVVPILKHYVLKSASLTNYILQTEKSTLSFLGAENFFSLKYILIMSFGLVLINTISFLISVLVVKHKEY